MESINTTKKNSKSVETLQSKRTLWNSRRNYNYRYVTTVF